MSKHTDAWRAAARERTVVLERFLQPFNDLATRLVAKREKEARRDHR